MVFLSGTTILIIIYKGIILMTIFNIIIDYIVQRIVAVVF